ncbi:hypothetical protein [Fonticella tunisiensis]|uniref:Uncharacterized protein n=1 Tax=Fonticella tunisiensis TaxID=1096341 RepID=A0A4R7KUX0_9CLOT|nr:hypothetical protein [Fonticella tunisiensis]TDT63402.1 hypothetical protein EDD71_102164 [Fonticella tunisiensis]
MRRNVLSLATSLALQASAEQGVDYTKAIPGALEEACLRLGVDRKKFIRMFAWSRGKENGKKKL